MTHADFYITAATVIPVLLLANAVQARFYRAYIGFCVRHTAERFRPHFQWIMTGVALYVAAAAAFGEYGAFSALNGGADTAGNRNGITAALLSLVVITAIALVLELLDVIWERPEREHSGQSAERALDNPIARQH